MNLKISRGKILYGTVLALTLLLALPRVIESAKAVPTWVGMGVCRKCHESNAIGNQYKAWASTPHAKTYQMLSSARAFEVGKKYGIAAPSDSPECLKCHTTGGGRIESLNAEGVGCEACHGPGSLYFEFSNHASFESRENAYRRAVTRGMYPIVGIDGIKAREKVCRHCHAENRPCLPDTPEERKRQKLPLSLIADFVFKHPARR